MVFVFKQHKCLCRNLAGNLPAGSQGLDRAAVMKYSAGIFELSGALAYQRAETAGRIARPSVNGETRCRKSSSAR